MSSQVQIKRSRQIDQIIACKGPLLVTGGPGSGKTTASILKAADIVENDLENEQRVLFLSFARASVSRVLEAIEDEHEMPLSQKRRIEVDTYHSFFWRLLKSHGCLLGIPRGATVLTPPREAVALSAIRNSYTGKAKLALWQENEKRERESAELLRLALDYGQVCFDLFAKFVGDLLTGSARVRRNVSIVYPTIILDEFQDTNADQWRVVHALGESARLIALADPEQRIYDWIGADPQRLTHFEQAFSPTVVPLGSLNHRSAGTEIVMFGDDLLKSSFSKRSYIGVALKSYPPYRPQAMSQLVTSVFDARSRLASSGKKSWSLGILVPTKKMVRVVADAFQNPPAGMSPIGHTAVVELEAAILGGEVVAHLMQPSVDADHFKGFIELLCNYYNGKGGDAPAQVHLKEAQAIRLAYEDLRSRQEAGREIKGNSLLVKTIAVYEDVRSVSFSGDPEADWIAIRERLGMGRCRRLKSVAEDVLNLRLLDRGTQLRQDLSADWRDNGNYGNALFIVRQSFLREHFSTAKGVERGVVVMNMHKAKGKQFDEVIVFEGWPVWVKGEIKGNPDRFVRGNLRSNCDDQARQNLRVSVTRGKQRTTILTPQHDPCVALL